MIKKFISNEPLKKYTTFKIGGPTEYFFEAKTTQDLISAVKYARQHHLSFFILGNGSNILVSDEGLKGLVIKNSSHQVKICNQTSSKIVKKAIRPRYRPLTKTINLSYDEAKYPQVLVQLDSGVFLPRAIFSLISQGITGLEWFAGIPATVGGACYINLHGADKYFSDYLVEAQVLTKNNQIKTVTADYFNFDYDDSKLKTRQDIILTATLSLVRGPKDTAMKIAQTWAEKKSHQPQVSAGCIFQNLSQKQQKKLNLPTPSIGYLMDKKLNLKGKTSGQAKISEKHAGFIENLGNAKAQDVISLINLMKQTAKKKLNLDLKLEIDLIGFRSKKV